VEPARGPLERILDQHPGVVLTAAYLLLTAVGITFEFWLFQRFGINVLDYSETSDFLMAVIREPLVIVLSVLPLPVLWLYLRANRWLRARSARYDAYFARYEGGAWSRDGRRFTYPLFVVIYFLLFILQYTEYVADRLKAGIGKEVRVELASGPPIPPGRSLLLGTTGRFVFLYYPVEGATRVIPVENVAQITVTPPRRRAADR
jgi:hypothetical protein